MKNEVKCNCGKGNKITCSKCSKLKMVILLKNGFEHLKTNGFNPVWYNHLSKNNKPDTTLINAMFRRFCESIYFNKTNCLIFYDNQTKEQITKIKL